MKINTGEQFINPDVGRVDELTLEFLQEDPVAWKAFLLAERHAACAVYCAPECECWMIPFDGTQATVMPCNCPPPYHPGVRRGD